ncbi:uncharacterized protein K452DRAFT_256985 [Aplosporella prunicola CBS 121167]|uniref:Galactose oxidase n=1 Tax=Aplosporella prunicola CBS 121167 TaxID=1176127 RepID=A0A6A6B1R2_9PEZI|nr:uncharacterized protein K452DRAFT_256985 [Aplosporella prunicola CBS 121167]KAF2138119.1 hypothetical protein K452DRAFT_256985 [Aplosporella prunicola CBS 121167]
MAEIAAGAVVAEQVVSTAIEGGVVAGVALSRRTMPLKATFTRIAISDLIRRHSHSITVIHDKAYIFGGITETGALAGDEVHVITLPPSKPSASHAGDTNYACIPALPAQDGGPVPTPRAAHSATAAGERILVWGGCDAAGHSLPETPAQLWAFDTASLRWTSIPVPEGPAGATHGVDPATGVWQSFSDQTLSRTTAPSAIAATGDRVYFVGGGAGDAGMQPPAAAAADANGDGESGRDSQFQAPVHYYDFSTQSWHTLAPPANPLVPGPRLPRDGAALHVVSTGHGRQYLLYMLGQDAPAAGSNAYPFPHGDNANAPRTAHAALWTFQIPAPRPSFAGAKDAARGALGMDSGCDSWAEVEVRVHDEEFAHAGKAHPGPRAWFASSTMGDQRGVVLWGGVDPAGEVAGDGWVVRVE